MKEIRVISRTEGCNNEGKPKPREEIASELCNLVNASTTWELGIDSVIMLPILPFFCTIRPDDICRLSEAP